MIDRPFRARQIHDGLYRRAEWDWATDGGDLLTHGWRPERGFLRHRQSEREIGAEQGRHRPLPHRHRRLHRLPAQL